MQQTLFMHHSRKEEAKMKNLLKIGIKAIFLLVITSVIWFILTPYFRIDKNTAGDHFRNLPENSLDVLILGSSHAQYSMNPAVFYTESGVYSYVLGSGCQPMTMSYYLLQEALKTQSPEVVVLDVFTMLPAQAVCYGEGMFYLAIDQMTGLNRLNAADAIDHPEKINQYKFDLLMNHGNWKRDEFKFEDITSNSLDVLMGHVPQQPTDLIFHHLVPKQRQSTNVELREKDVEALLNINELCKENNIQLILIKAICDLDQSNIDALYKVWDIAEEYNIEYVDFMQLAEEIGFTFGMNGDTWHNNSWGAEKTTKYLAHYIQDKEYVKNHQNNEVFDRLLATLRGYTSKALMEQNISIYDLLSFATKYDVTMIVKYSGWYETTITEYENSLLNKAGIKHDFINQCTRSYYAIIENGTTLIESYDPLETDIDGTKITIDENRIEIGNQIYEGLGELEIIFCGNNFEWFNEMPIDYAARFFWKNGCDGWVCEVE